jgi:ADP-L-glycero-D-manno-heptose 6-epimerase
MYASSAATYGDGNLGFIDDHNIVHKLIPLNLYAKSKNDFDQFVLTQSITPPHWFGFKFFNVFGFDESRKGKMSSIIYQAFNKINMDNKMQLFKSYNDSFLHGFQERDFVYINDVINVLLFFMGIPYSGIYNLGSGKSTTYISLIESVFKSMSIESNIEFVEMPLALREKYQYSTKADLKKLRSVGYNRPFMNITESIDDYVCKYLTEK